MEGVGGHNWGGGDSGFPLPPAGGMLRMRHTDPRGGIGARGRRGGGTEDQPPWGSWQDAGTSWGGGSGGVSGLAVSLFYVFIFFAGGC